ncbi:MAG: hypothetical protein AAFR59_09045 [Bacteroidota bacterium]
MSKYFFILPFVLLLACGQGPQNEAPTTQDLSTRKELSRFSCSDTALNQLYTRVTQGYGNQIAPAFPDTMGDFSSTRTLDLKQSGQLLSYLPNLPYQRSAQVMLDMREDLPYPFPLAYYLMKANHDQAPDNRWDQAERWLQLFGQTTMAHPEEEPQWVYPDFIQYAYTQRAIQTALQFGPAEITPELASKYPFFPGVEETVSLQETLGPSILNKLRANGIRYFPFLEAPTTLSFGDELIWGLAFDLFPTSLRPTLTRTVVQGILEDGFTLDSLSLLGQAYVLPLLSTSGNHEVASRLVQDTSWYVGDTAKENIVGHWLLTEAAGIQYENQEIVLSPKLTKGLTYTEGQLQTRHGLFFCRIDNQKPIRIQVLSPAEATLVLPVKDPTKATVICNQVRIWLGSQPQPMPEGMEVMGVKSNEIILRIPRGKFEFLIKS